MVWTPLPPTFNSTGALAASPRVRYLEVGEAWNTHPGAAAQHDTLPRPAVPPLGRPLVNDGGNAPRSYPEPRYG